MVLLEANQEKYTIEGIYNLTSIYDNIYLYDSYSIRIEIKTSYPKEMPQVFSLDKKIPKVLIIYIQMVLFVLAHLWSSTYRH